MSAASRALADVRGWLCDNLSEGDAGKVCGMLSVVSRHITELESENAKLRACLGNGCADCAVGMGEYADSICDQIKSENAKLRELVRIMHGELVSCEDNGYVCGGHKFDDRVRELGIEVPYDN